MRHGETWMISKSYSWLWFIWVWTSICLYFLLYHSTSVLPLLLYFQMWHLWDILCFSVTGNSISSKRWNQKGAWNHRQSHSSVIPTTSSFRVASPYSITLFPWEVPLLPGFLPNSAALTLIKKLSKERITLISKECTHSPKGIFTLCESSFWKHFPIKRKKSRKLTLLAQSRCFYKLFLKANSQWQCLSLK